MDLLKERIRREGKVLPGNIIKVDGFLKYIGSRTCLQLSSVRADELCRLIDECVSGALDSEVHRTAEMLRDREQENVKGAAALLRLSGD